MVKKKNLLQRIFRFADSGGYVPSTSDPLVEIMRATGQNPNGPTPAENWFIHKTPTGSMGTEIYAGYPREEYLHELYGKDRAKIFDKMRRSDTQVAMLLRSIVNPIKSAVWEMEPASDDPEDQRRSDLIEHILFKDMSKVGGFPRFVEEALTSPLYGHAVFEKTYKLVFDHPQFGTYHGVKGLDLISAKTIYRWNVDQDGKLISVTQIAIGDMHRYVDIPAQFLMIFSNDMEGANYEGISLLRACYGNWLRKNMMLKLNIIGIEKFAVPTPVATIPSGKQSTEQYTNLITALEVYTSGQANYLTIPEDYKLDFSNRTQYDPAKVDSAIDAEDRRMAKAFLANFLELGMNNRGSFGMSEDLSDFFLSGIEHIASGVSEQVNTNLIPEICNLNFADQRPFPKLKHSGITDKAGKELADVLSVLAGAQVLVPDDPLEENVRKRYNLPKKSDLGRRDAPPKDESQVPSAGFGGGGGKASLSERIRRRLYA